MDVYTIELYSEIALLDQPPMPITNASNGFLVNLFTKFGLELALPTEFWESETSSKVLTIKKSEPMDEEKIDVKQEAKEISDKEENVMI